MVGVKKFEHGTRSRYGAGCRCAKCRAAWAFYMREYKHARKITQPRRDSRVLREISTAESRLAEIEPDELIPAPCELSALDYKILLELQRRSRSRRNEVISQMLRRTWREEMATA